MVYWLLVGLQSSLSMLMLVFIVYAEMLILFTYFLSSRDV